MNEQLIQYTLSETTEADMTADEQSRFDAYIDGICTKQAEEAEQYYSGLS